MNSNTNLISVGKFELKPRHLLIIGILSLSFSISFLIRSQPAGFAWELNEFDPFFNYRATQYIVENGIESYFNWNDELSWYPYGRDVSQTSQVALHLTAAITYWLFGANGNLYDFTILFPVVIGSLTTIVIFALVRVIGGTTAGLFSSLLFSISIPLILRGSLGWFKSEPLGLFFSLLGLYLLLSGIKSKNNKIALMKLIFAGIFIMLGLSAWGGDQFFIIPIGVLFLILPFLRNDHKFLLWGIPLFTISTIITSFAFERLGQHFIFGLGGLSLVISTIFLVSCIFIQKMSKVNKKRNGLLFLSAILVLSVILLIVNTESEFLPLPTHRYLNAINPFLITSDPLIDSIAEHATTSITTSFLFHSILMIFSGLGAWLILKNISNNSSYIDNDMTAFSLIIGLIGIYVSSAFVRLEVFASISTIILSSLGLSILSKEFFVKNNKNKNSRNLIITTSFITGIIILLATPLVFPVEGSLVSLTNSPPTISNGGTSYHISTTDWNDALEWIKLNTSTDAVVGSWWDYGYWIQTKAERASLADNSTVHDVIIKKIAQILTNSPDEGWRSLHDMNADYFIVFVSGQRLAVDNDDVALYLLRGGGDESKKQWFIRIANEPLEKYLHNDGISGTDYFWNETLLGKMIPFSPLAYVNLQNPEQQSTTYQPGFTPVYVKDIKFPSNGDGPFRLVYSSPSFDAEQGGIVTGVFVYQINKNYIFEN